MRNKNWKLYFFLALLVAGYFLFGYFIQRENFIEVASVYLVLFAAYVFIARRSSDESFTLLLIAAILFRLIFLFSIPKLSDDYFRFIWDGKMTNMGVNPFSQIPSFFILYSDHPDPYLMHLYAQMNSQDYYSIYPPVMQFIFAFAVWLFPGNITGAVVVMRIFCVAAEIGTLFLLKKLLEHFHLQKTNLFWYALNPLVIIELSGNIHFEAVMIFFLLLAVWMLLTSLRGAERRNTLQRFQSAIMYGFSICTKLIPLLFLPFLVKRLEWKKSFVYFIITGISFMLLFLPFIDKQLIENIGSSVDLYFQKFEFNASIYYIIRWIGFEVKGYDIIQSAGPWLAIAVFISVMILMIAEKKISERNFFFMMQWSLTIYLLLSTTVHPWYLTTLVMLSVFTEMKFAIVWSLVVILSYATYQTQPYHENLWLTSIEYVLVISVLGLEISGAARIQRSGYVKTS